jgi:hypothetical protein
MTTEPLQNETTPRQTTSDTSQPGWGAPKAKPAQRWSGGKTAAPRSPSRRAWPASAAP